MPRLDYKTSSLLKKSSNRKGNLHETYKK
jgi:hypothetical protein